MKRVSDIKRTIRGKMALSKLQIIIKSKIRIMKARK